MSGGSLDYLYCEPGSNGRLGQLAQYQKAFERLEALGHGGTPAGIALWWLIDDLRKLMAIAEALSPVLKAVEWEMSCDIDASDLADEVARWSKP